MPKFYRYRKNPFAGNYSIEQWLPKLKIWRHLYDAPDLKSARREVKILQHCKEDWDSKVVIVKETTVLVPAEEG